MHNRVGGIDLVSMNESSRTYDNYKKKKKNSFYKIYPTQICNLCINGNFLWAWFWFEKKIMIPWQWKKTDQIIEWFEGSGKSFNVQDEKFGLPPFRRKINSVNKWRVQLTIFVNFWWKEVSIICLDFTPISDWQS